MTKKKINYDEHPWLLIRDFITGLLIFIATIYFIVEMVFR